MSPPLLEFETTVDTCAATATATATATAATAAATAIATATAAATQHSTAWHSLACFNRLADNVSHSCAAQICATLSAPQYTIHHTT